VVSLRLNLHVRTPGTLPRFGSRIIARRQALAYAGFHTNSCIKSDIASFLAGRIAESVLEICE